MSGDYRMNIFLQEVKYPDIQMLRIIRNDCREYMTNNTDIITEEEQILWFDNLDGMIPYILFESFHGVAFTPIGYGIVKLESECATLTGGLMFDYRNKGYGRYLFGLLIEEAKKYNSRVCLQVLKTNTRAYTLYQKLGFKVIAETDVLYTMVLDEN